MGRLGLVFLLGWGVLACGGDDDGDDDVGVDAGAVDASSVVDASPTEDAAPAEPCADCPVCADGQIQIVGMVGDTPVDLDLEIFSYSHEALAARITVQIREMNDFVDSFVIEYDRRTPDIRGKTFAARGSADLQLNASVEVASCPSDGRNGTIVFGPRGDQMAQFEITDFRAPGADPCAAEPVSGTLRGCWND